MKNYLFGTGQFAYKVADLFDKNGIKIDGFVNVKDKNKKLPNKVYKDIPVCYVDDLIIEDKKECNIFLAKKPMFMGKGIDFFRKNNYKNIFAINEELFFGDVNSINDLRKYIDKIDLSQPFLNYLEINLVDNCNLNCKGCAHFSNICSNNYVDIATLESDLEKLSNIFNIYTFRLLGGEPLLHPNLEKVLEISRFYLPKSRLFLVTNGLLLDKISEDVLNAISLNNVIISISLYEPTFNKIDVITKRLEKHNIKYLINDDYFGKNEIIKQFHSRLSKTKINNYDANKSCSGRFCRFVRNGRMSKCYLPLLIDIVNKKYNCNYDVSSDDYLLLDEITDGWNAIDILNEDIPFCRYCREDLYNFDWECGHKDDSLDSFVLKKTK